jgi:hypothetical protein
VQKIHYPYSPSFTLFIHPFPPATTLPLTSLVLHSCPLLLKVSVHCSVGFYLGILPVNISYFNLLLLMSKNSQCDNGGWPNSLKSIHVTLKQGRKWRLLLVKQMLSESLMRNAKCLFGDNMSNEICMFFFFSIWDCGVVNDLTQTVRHHWKEKKMNDMVTVFHFMTSALPKYLVFKCVPQFQKS